MDNNKGKDKRRRIEKQSDQEPNRKKQREDDATEEEVEEFFAILRRMQVAVKYFEKGNGEGWRAAVEAEVVAVVGDGDGARKDEKIKIRKEAVVEEEAVLLDLNALPEVETHEA